MNKFKKNLINSVAKQRYKQYNKNIRQNVNSVR